MHCDQIVTQKSRGELFILVQPIIIHPVPDLWILQISMVQFSLMCIFINFANLWNINCSTGPNSSNLRFCFIKKRQPHDFIRRTLTENISNHQTSQLARNYHQTTKQSILLEIAFIWCYIHCKLVTIEFQNRRKESFACMTEPRLKKLSVP